MAKKQLKPTDLFTNLVATLMDKPGFTWINRIIDKNLTTAGSVAMYTFKEDATDDLVFICSPVVDTNEPTKLEAGTVAPEKLLTACKTALVNSGPANSYRFVIPVATTGKILGKRHEHFLMLQLEFDSNKQLMKAECVDSQNLPVKYSIAELKQNVKSVFGEEPKEEYLGSQGATNITDCALYVYANAMAAIEREPYNKKLKITEEDHAAQQKKCEQWKQMSSLPDGTTAKSNAANIVQQPTQGKAKIVDASTSEDESDEDLGFDINDDDFQQPTKEQSQRLIPTDPGHDCSYPEKNVDIALVAAVAAVKPAAPVDIKSLIHNVLQQINQFKFEKGTNSIPVEFEQLQNNISQLVAAATQSSIIDELNKFIAQAQQPLSSELADLQNALRYISDKKIDNLKLSEQSMTFIDAFTTINEQKTVESSNHKLPINLTDQRHYIPLVKALLMMRSDVTGYSPETFLKLNLVLGANEKNNNEQKAQIELFVSALESTIKINLSPVDLLSLELTEILQDTSSFLLQQ